MQRDATRQGAVVYVRMCFATVYQTLVTDYVVQKP